MENSQTLSISFSLNIKSVRESAPISLEIKSERVIEKQKLVHGFNSYYTNTAQNTSRRIQSKLGAINPSLIDIEMVKLSLGSYKKHPSIKLIKENLSQKGSFHFANASVKDVNNIIRNINLNEATSPEKILPKLVKLSANVKNAYLTCIFNRDISLNFFSQAKLHQKGQFLNRKIEIKNYNIVNYKPVSILKCFSKIYERFFYYQVRVYINKISLDLMVANRKGFGTNHLLVKFIENWKKVLDNSSFFTRAIFMDLFKGVQKSCS